MANLPDACLDRIFVLFPDPWPKSRHNKRRIIQSETVSDFARLLRPGGRLRFASDWADYINWSLARFLANPDFRWTASCAQDWRQGPQDHITTRYEEKGLGDCAPVFLDFSPESQPAFLWRSIAARIRSAVSSASAQRVISTDLPFSRSL